MIAGLSVLQGISQAATGSLVAAVWQGVALAAAVGVGLRLLPKTPAAVRFAIWFAVFVVVAGLPAIALWPHAAGAVRVGGRGAWVTLDARWCVAIAAVWAVASVVRAGTLAVAAFQVRRLWKRAVPVEIGGASGLHPTHRDTAAMDGAPGLWLRGIVRERRAQICSSEEVDRPSVIGFFAPKILIPRWLLEKLTAAELEQIVLHETGHLGRADDWLNLAQKIALVVFPLNPALAWVERRLCFERELACDERVLRARGRGAAKAYAACLAGLAEHRLGRAGLALALGALGRESELGRRVREILGGAERMRPAQARLVLGGAVLGLVAAAAGLSRCPQVVGFSQGAAVASAPKVDLADRAQFQTVGFRGTEIHLYNNGLQQRSNVPHETLLEALTPSLNGGYGDDTISRGLKPEVIRGSMSGLKPGPISGTRAAVDISGTRAAVDFSGTRAAVDVSGTRAAVDVSGARSSPFDKLRAGSGAPGTVAVQRQPTLRDEAAKDGPPSEVAVEAPIRREGPTGEGAVGWVVVTTWEGADGSRLVLTTFDTAEPARSAPPPAILDDQVHPYAAVPLRDGWLVIQL